jgi:hypothetical protein
MFSGTGQYAGILAALRPAADAKAINRRSIPPGCSGARRTANTRALLGFYRGLKTFVVADGFLLELAEGVG